MTNAQFTTPTVPAQWAETRETDWSVAMAIHAISDEERTPEAIWEDPTLEEYNSVCQALQSYAEAGDIDEIIGDVVHWGCEFITIGEPL